MDTFKAIALPLAVLVLTVAYAITLLRTESRRSLALWALVGVAGALSVIALFVTLDAVT